MITKEQLAKLKEEARETHRKWCFQEAEYRDKEREYYKAYQLICKHPKTRVVEKDWFEPPMRETARWKEEVCVDCQKILARSSQKEVWTKL